MPASRCRVSSSSTPSAATLISRLCASWIVQLTMAASVALERMRSTKERSTFTSLTGSVRRCESDECPVPKSSSEIRTPSSPSRASTSPTRSTSNIAEFSVTSRMRTPGSTWCHMHAVATSSGNCASRRSVNDTLTATCTSWPASRQR